MSGFWCISRQQMANKRSLWAASWAILLSVADGVARSLDNLVNDVKQLARDAGLPNLWVWIGRSKVKVEDLTEEGLKELMAEGEED